METGVTNIQGRSFEVAAAELLAQFPPAVIGEVLWTVFRCASLGGLEKECGDCAPERVAELFDGIMALMQGGAHD